MTYDTTITHKYTKYAVEYMIKTGQISENVQIDSGILYVNPLGSHTIESIESSLHNMENSVQALENVSNEAYDDLLSNNIVFLDLIDASAVNTILECIMRNTPLIVNKIPPVTELLGDTYPLYIENIDKKNNKEIETMICDAYIHLCKLDKTHFTFDTFMNTIRSVVGNELDIVE